MYWKKTAIACGLFLLLLLLVNPARAAFRETDAALTVSGTKLSDPVFLRGGTLYAPLRPLAELTQSPLLWSARTKTAYLVTPRGIFPFSQTGGSLFIDNRLYTPVRQFAQSMAMTVFWDNARCTASLEAEKSYSQDELLWLARIICAEACGEPTEGKIAVGNVVLNRVRSPEFPDTIYDVIFDRAYGVQFEPVLNGTVWNEPDTACIEAAKRALEGESVVGESLYFFNPVLAESTWIAENRRFYTSIGGHDFYL